MLLVVTSSSSGVTSSSSSVMEQRKRKRMISNRESARRSRMRKQKLLDDLTDQIARLREENHQIVTRVSIATQQYLCVEAENSVLTAQLDELTHRLDSLNDIIAFSANANNNNNSNSNGLYGYDDLSWMNMNMNMFYLNHPLMASVDASKY